MDLHLWSPLQDGSRCCWESTKWLDSSNWITRLESVHTATEHLVEMPTTLVKNVRHSWCLAKMMGYKTVTSRRHRRENMPRKTWNLNRDVCNVKMHHVTPDYSNNKILENWRLMTNCKWCRTEDKSLMEDNGGNWWMCDEVNADDVIRLNKVQHLLRAQREGKGTRRQNKNENEL